MATPVLLDIEEYLHTGYGRDVEYIDGELRERAMVFSVHGLVQSKIAAWFESHEQEWGIRAGVEVRTQVSSTRVRLPDVVVDHARYWPPVLVKPPLIAIEIVSPSDSYGHIQDVVRDYQAMGVPNIWVIDPAARTALVCKAVPWVPVTRFVADGSSIFLDVTALFHWIDQYPPE